MAATVNTPCNTCGIQVGLSYLQQHYKRYNSSNAKTFNCACQIMKSPHTEESSPKTIFVWSVERHLYRSDSKWKQDIDAQNQRDDAYMQDLQEVFKNEITWSYPALCATINLVQDWLWIHITRWSMQTPPFEPEVSKNSQSREFSTRVSFIFSRSTTRNDFLKSWSRLETWE